MNRASHLFGAEKGRLFVGVRDEQDRPRDGAPAQCSRNLEQRRSAARVVVRARELAPLTERVIVRADDEQRFRRSWRAEFSADVLERLPSRRELLNLDPRTGLSEFVCDVRGGPVEIRCVLHIAWPDGNGQELHIPPQPLRRSAVGGVRPENDDRLTNGRCRNCEKNQSDYRSNGSSPRD